MLQQCAFPVLYTVFAQDLTFSITCACCHAALPGTLHVHAGHVRLIPVLMPLLPPPLLPLVSLSPALLPPLLTLLHCKCMPSFPVCT